MRPNIIIAMEMSANKQNILARITAHNYLTCTIHFHLSDFLCINHYIHYEYAEGFALQCFIVFMTFNQIKCIAPVHLSGKTTWY